MSPCLHIDASCRNYLDLFDRAPALEARVAASVDPVFGTARDVEGGAGLLTVQTEPAGHDSYAWANEIPGRSDPHPAH